MKRPLVHMALGVLLAGFLFWWFSPTQVLKRRTNLLLQTLSLDSDNARSGRQLAVYSLNSLLASEVELGNPTIQQANGTFERADLESAFTWLTQQARTTRFDLKRFDSVTITGDTGEVGMLLDALVELPAYRPVDGLYQARLRWRREDDGWRLERAVWIEAEP